MSMGQKQLILQGVLSYDKCIELKFKLFHLKTVFRGILT